MKIKTKELLQIITRLRASLACSLKEERDLGAVDYYWDMEEPDLYNPLGTAHPDNLSLGQISADWEELLRLSDENSIPIAYDLKRLAVILKAISAKVILF